MNRLAVAGTVLLLAVSAAAPAADAPLRKVRLHVTGGYCAGCASVLADSLVQGGVQNASKIAPNRGRGYVIVLGEIPEDLDLSTLADTIIAAETPHKALVHPAVALELVAPLDEDSAEKALAILAQIKGVDGKGSTADPKTGVISVKLAGGEKLTVDVVLTALNDGGIKAEVVTEPKPAE